MAKRKRKSGALLAGLLATRTRRRIGATLLGLLLLGLAQGFLMLVPYERVPPRYQGAYRYVLNWRNTVWSRSGLPWDWYPARASIDTAGGQVQVFFAPSPSIDERLVEVLNGATASIDMAIYDLDLDDVVAALVAAHRRGLRVRLVTDSDNLYLAELEPLKLAGVPLRGDDRNPIMHNKFVIVDGRRVWTGSFNFTRNGATRNDNNAILLDSPLLAANYQAEFDEMWAGQFGPDSPAATPYPRLRLGDLEVATCFAPEDQVQARLLEAVSQAQSRIDLMAFSFTAEPLARAIRDRAAAGVVVRCLFDARQAESEYSQDDWLARQDVEVRLSANRRGVMHHKVIIIDGRTVITGSFNFSTNADSANDENLLILDSSDLAAVYTDEFERCWLGLKGY